MIFVSTAFILKKGWNYFKASRTHRMAEACLLARNSRIHKFETEGLDEELTRLDLT